MKKLAPLLGILLASAVFPISDKDLQEAGWGPAYAGLGEHMTFKNGIYTKEMQGPGGMTCSGKYTVSNNKVNLKKGSDDHNESVDCSPMVCKVKRDKKHLSTVAYLQCKNLKYWSSLPAHQVPAGTVRKLKGRKIVIVGESGTVTTSRLMKRSGPSAKSKPVKCMSHGEGMPREKTVMLGKDASVDVIAKTPKAYKIGKMKSPWYYVYVEEDGEIEQCDSEFFWVYGHYVKLGAEEAAPEEIKQGWLSDDAFQTAGGGIGKRACAMATEMAQVNAIKGMVSTTITGGCSRSSSKYCDGATRFTLDLLKKGKVISKMQEDEGCTVVFRIEVKGLKQLVTAKVNSK